MPYEPVQSSRLFEQITEQIEQQILRGELQSGDRLPAERELAEQFHASRTAVREAMKILSQKGLLQMRPGRGTIVINGTSQALRDSLGLMLRVGQPEGARELVEVREILEPGIAALAAARATHQDIALLREAVEIMDGHLHDADAFISADNFFHQVLAGATQNVLVLTLMDPIMELLSKQRKQIFTIEGGPMRGQSHHKQILEAVVRHDSEAARQAMSAHLQQVRVDVSAAQEVRANQKG